MGRLIGYNSEANNDRPDGQYYIRVPLRMTQLTERDGCAWPLAFEWQDESGIIIRVKVDKVISVVPCAELKSGAVGDRYECEIKGRREYLFYSKLQPRKWFKLHEVSMEEYTAYYEAGIKGRS